MRDTPLPPAPPGPIAYLTGEYPKVSHTFIQREVEGMRALGMAVLTCSVRRSGPDQQPGPEEREAARTTFYLLAAAKNPLRLLSDHWALLRCAPRRWLTSLWLALRTQRPGWRGLIWQLFYFAEAGVLAEHLRRNGVFHLHNHFGDSSCSVAMLASALSGIPFSYTLHGPTELFEPTGWRLDEKIARAAYVICISHFARSQAMLFSDPSHWSRLHIVHCGVNPALYDHPRTVADGAARLLFVGRLAAVKGVPVLLEAMAAVRAAHPGAVLTLVGDGPDRKMLERRATELGIAEAVRFVGYCSQADVAAHLRQADLFVLPSFAEGLPVVLMEALASRLPVVTTRIAGVAELVEDGVNGFLVAPGDASGLGDRIAELLADAALRQRMGEQGRARVCEAFDIATETTRLHAVLMARRIDGTDPGLRPAPTPQDGRSVTS